MMNALINEKKEFYIFASHNPSFKKQRFKLHPYDITLDILQQLPLTNQMNSDNQFL